MRRKDREMDVDFALEIIDKAQFGVLSLAKGNQPYGLPLSMARDDKRLLFHTALEGQKFEFLEEEAKVHVVFVSGVKVPELYSKDELKELASTEKGTGSLLSKVFTTEFSSAMVRGTIKELKGKEDKTKALEVLCRKYTPDKMEFFKAAAKSGGPLTRVFAVMMEDITAKRKAFDKEGMEMKFGRTEE